MRPESNKSVLLVGNFLSQKGFSPSTGEILAKRLRSNGHEVLITSKESNKVLRFLDMLSSALRWRKKYAIAYVEVYSGKAFVWSAAVSKVLSLIGKPFVLSLHGGNLPQFATRHPKLVRNLLDSASAVVAPSGYLQQGLVEFSDKIGQIPNGIDIGLYEFSLRNVIRPKLVWLRAFHEIYNPTMAVTVLANLSESWPEATLKMVGADKDGSRGVVRALAGELNVDDQLITPGRIAKGDVPQYLSESDIFINTTNIDNTPVSVVEAMACGLCVVSTDVGGIPFLLEHNETALLVPPNDPTAMAAAIGRLFTEPKLAQYLSRNARRKVEQFSWDMVMPQWLELFDSVSNLKN